eukprot:15328441-Ditylum_brightwellii.AAC.1
MQWHHQCKIFVKLQSFLPKEVSMLITNPDPLYCAQFLLESAGFADTLTYLALVTFEKNFPGH